MSQANAGHSEKMVQHHYFWNFLANIYSKLKQRFIFELWGQTGYFWASFNTF